jgi:hypothetical protein
MFSTKVIVILVTFRFFWAKCYDFFQVCISNQDKSEQRQLGDASRAAFEWDDDSGNVIASYTSGKDVVR